MAANTRKTKFQRELKEAETEGREVDIQDLWRAELKKELPKAKIISTHNTDGILTANVPHKDKEGILTFTDLHTLLEFKDKKGFKNKRIRCAVIMQALFYLHNIMEAKQKVPTTIFIGDGSQCFFLHTNVLGDYLNTKTFSAPGQVPTINWTVAPSQAHINNIPVLDHMEKDKVLDNTLIIDVQSDTFRVKDIFPILEEITRNTDKKIKITEHNLISAFQYFKDCVVMNKRTTLDIGDEKKRVSRLIDVFYNCITDRKTTQPNKNGDISTRGEVIQVNKTQYQAFFDLFEQDKYSQSEREKLVSVKDQVLEEISRRMTGAYFTPEIWLKKAHEMISEQFGNDWKDTYVVWDCASGTNNLTRQDKFRELYNSTLEQGDVDTVKDMEYPGTTFQYDFLNEDSESLKKKSPTLVKALIEKKPILFLINPPYGTAKSGTLNKGENKKGIANTVTNCAMKTDNMGACSQQLYAQFLYRILMLKKEYGLTDVKICIFSAPLFMSGEGYSEFRKAFNNHFNFKDGMLFKADQFADVSGEWGISFTVWEGKQCS